MMGAGEGDSGVKTMPTQRGHRKPLWYWVLLCESWSQKANAFLVAAPLSCRGVLGCLCSLSFVHHIRMQGRNKVPQTEWFKHQKCIPSQFCKLQVRSKCWQSCAPSEGARRSVLGLSPRFWQFLACGSRTPVFTRRSPWVCVCLCVQTSPFLLRQQSY